MKARLKGGARTRITSLAVLARANFEQPDEPLLPTPRSADSIRGRDYRDRKNGPDLNTAVEGLLPTPSAWLGRRPSHSEPNPERLKGVDKTGADKRTLELVDAIALLPTPTTRDYKGRNQRDDDSCLPGAVGKMLPTPTASHRGDRSEASRAKGGGNEIRAIAKLLPTPMANPDNPGAGGELRAALTHGPGRRNETGVDSWGRPNRGRPKLLPTPTESDGDSAGNRTGNPDSKAHPGTTLTDFAKSSGANTPPPSKDGDESSADPRPVQLTLEDLSTPDSSSG
jgi:hypothetical protein